jgi:hypothetical protein
MLPLATAVIVSPTAGDAQRLLDAYDVLLGRDEGVRANKKFVLYRILLALVALSDASLLSASERVRGRKVARHCLDLGDKPLKALARAVLNHLKWGSRLGTEKIVR